MAAWLLGLACAARAGRFIAVPFAETLPAGRYSLWQFGLYEQKSTKSWRALDRLDLGLWEGLELGVLVISPKHKTPDTWVNLQYRPIVEGRRRPGVAVGVWDAFRKDAPLFSSRAVGASPFIALSKGYAKGKRYVKAGLNLGANRLNGVSGGVDVRFLDATGVQGEYAPRNIRLKGADAWDASMYQWIGPYVRVRGARMGGNPMIDGFFTYAFGGK